MEYRDLQARRRASRTPENSFYQIPQSPYRYYNQDGRCVYVPDAPADAQQNHTKED